VNSTKPLTAEELTSALQHFTGSENSYFRETLSGRIDYTEGVRFLQQQNCYWLTDAIASYQTSEFKQSNDRQFWKLSVDLLTRQATLTCDDGDGNISVTQSIEFTDFPLVEIRIWVEVNQRVFMYLPSEY
jgi:hypothetical protein